MQLQENIETFQSLNAEIWVAANDDPEKLEALRQKHGLSFPILVDEGLATTSRYGLSTDDGKLPHPTAMIIAPDGTITYLRVDEDYSERPDPSELAEALTTELSPSTDG